MNGQVVVVTGASAGIGRACARAFAARGDSVALLARGGTGLAAAAEDVERRGGHAVAIETDVAETGQPKPADEPDNLDEPADAGTDFGAHGSFDGRAHARSGQLWASQHHGAAALEQAADDIDDDPLDRKDASARRTLRVRTLVEGVAADVMTRVGHRRTSRPGRPRAFGWRPLTRTRWCHRTGWRGSSGTPRTAGRPSPGRWR